MKEMCKDMNYLKIWQVRLCYLAWKTKDCKYMPNHLWDIQVQDCFSFFCIYLVWSQCTPMTQFIFSTYLESTMKTNYRCKNIHHLPKIYLSNNHRSYNKLYFLLIDVVVNKRSQNPSLNHLVYYFIWICLCLSCVPWFSGTVYHFVKHHVWIRETRVYMTNLTRFEKNMRNLKISYF